MRRILLLAIFLALPWTSALERTTFIGAPAVAMAADEAPAAAPATPKAPDVDVNVNRTERHVISFANPTVLAVGAGVLVLLVVLFAMASRGGGTTIVKEK
jgi:hypothetical protein